MPRQNLCYVLQSRRTSRSLGTIFDRAAAGAAPSAPNRRGSASACSTLRRVRQCKQRAPFWVRDRLSKRSERHLGPLRRCRTELHLPVLSSNDFHCNRYKPPVPRPEEVHTTRKYVRPPLFSAVRGLCRTELEPLQSAVPTMCTRKISQTQMARRSEKTYYASVRVTLSWNSWL